MTNPWEKHIEVQTRDLNPLLPTKRHRAETCSNATAQRVGNDWICLGCRDVIIRRFGWAKKPNIKNSK